jgi:integrase
MSSAYKRKNKDGSVTWYAKYRDDKGDWTAVRTTARTRVDAKKLAHELDAKWEKVRLGLAEHPGKWRGDFRGLCELVYERYFSRLKGAESDKAYLRRHAGVGSKLGANSLEEVTTAELNTYFTDLEQEGLAGLTINRLRNRFKVVFDIARQEGLFAGDNPVDATRKRKEKKSRRDHVLTPEQIARLFAALAPEWRGIFAVCFFAGLRKGEAFALLESDVDLERRLIFVQRSHENYGTKAGETSGGETKIDAVPIPRALMPYLEVAKAHAAPAGLMFPDPKTGERRLRSISMPRVLRRALVRAGIIDHYRHACRAFVGRGTKGQTNRCGYVHPETSATPEERRCPECGGALNAVPVPPNMTFHEGRHTYGTLALESDASLQTVQKLMRHSDPRLTTERYGHMRLGYLVGEADKIDFGLAEQMSSLLAGAAPPAPAATVGGEATDHGTAVSAAPVPRSAKPSHAGGAYRGTPLVRGEILVRGAAASVSANLAGSILNRTVEPTGIEPVTYALRTQTGGVPGTATASQLAVKAIAEAEPESSDSQPVTAVSEEFVTPLLRDVTSLPAPAPVLKRLLTVTEVAELLRLGPDWVRRQIKSGVMPHHKFGAAVRVSESDLAAFIRRAQR